MCFPFDFLTISNNTFLMSCIDEKPNGNLMFYLSYIFLKRSETDCEKELG